VRKNTVTSNKTTGTTADKKKTVGSEKNAVGSKTKKAPLTAPSPALATKAVAAKEVAPKAVAQPSAKKPAISMLPDHDQPKLSAPISAESIATRAYLLWEEDGCQHGRHDEYWLRAEQLLKSKAHK
jgi:hypothetical protein